MSVPAGSARASRLDRPEDEHLSFPGAVLVLPGVAARELLQASGPQLPYRHRRSASFGHGHGSRCRRACRSSSTPRPASRTPPRVLLVARQPVFARLRPQAPRSSVHWSAARALTVHSGRDPDVTAARGGSLVLGQEVGSSRAALGRSLAGWRWMSDRRPRGAELRGACSNSRRRKRRRRSSPARSCSRSQGRDLPTRSRPRPLALARSAPTDPRNAHTFYETVLGFARPWMSRMSRSDSRSSSTSTAIVVSA
jgi:hypothetical protein